MNHNYKIDEQKINQLLNELDEDRNKYFCDIKNSSSFEKNKEIKIKALEHIQRQLLAYKRLLIKEKEEKE